VVKDRQKRNLRMRGGGKEKKKESLTICPSIPHAIIGETRGEGRLGPGLNLCSKFHAEGGGREKVSPPISQIAGRERVLEEKEKKLRGGPCIKGVCPRHIGEKGEE